jgi:hypothetical protein
MELVTANVAMNGTPLGLDGSAHAVLAIADLDGHVLLTSRVDVKLDDDETPADRNAWMRVVGPTGELLGEGALRFGRVEPREGIATVKFVAPIRIGAEGVHRVLILGIEPATTLTFDVRVGSTVG